MRFLTKTESEERFSGNGWPVDPAKPKEDFFGISAKIPQSFTKVFWLSQVLSESFVSFDSCLLWITTWRVWSSSENLHLFYKLRETYSERRLLGEAPGHFFQKYEQADLATFIHIAILSGWDFHLQPSPKWLQGFISHDEWFELFSIDEANLNDVKDILGRGKIDFKTFRTPISEYRIK
jgi:hypothetical protein